MGRYGDLRHATLPSNVEPSRTSKVLTPGIVLATVTVLASSSIIGAVIASSIFSSPSPHSSGVSATQGLILIACSLSMIYNFFHFLAALKNDPVGPVRPPELRLHACCFIIARLAIVAWMIALISCCVVVSKVSVCKSGSRDCKLQIIDVVISGLAFLATGIILTILDSCNYPFQTPEMFHVTRKITCRVSSFGDDILERSASRTSSIKEEAFPEKRENSARRQEQHGTKRKRQQPSPASMPGEYPVECSMTPLQPISQKSRAREWGEEWTHVLDDNKSKPKGNSKSNSATSSSSSETSSGDTNTSYQSSNLSVSKGSAGPRTVTPSSSISNESRRSPLSTMRSAEYPDVVIHPELRILPPAIPPTYDWNTARAASMSRLLPVADVHSLQRRPSATPAPLTIRKLSRESAAVPKKAIPIPRKAIPKRGIPLTRKNTIDVKVPGAYIDYRLSIDDEQKLVEHARKIELELLARRKRAHLNHKSEEHMRKIELESLARRKTAHLDQEHQLEQHVRKIETGLVGAKSTAQEQRHKVTARLPAGQFEIGHVPNAVDSRTRYREHRRDVPRSRTTAVGGPRLARPDSTDGRGALGVDFVKVSPLRRLSLGAMPGPGFGDLCEVEIVGDGGARGRRAPQ